MLVTTWVRVVILTAAATIVTGTNCSLLTECGTCVKNLQCAWCETCVSGDLLGPLGECSLGTKYHYATCDNNDFGETIKGLTAAGGLLIGILTALFGYRLIVIILAAVSFCIGAWIPYFIASKIIYQALSTYSPTLLYLVCLSTGVLFVVSYVLAYVGKFPVIFFKSSVLGLGLLAGCLFTALLLSGRTSQGCLLSRLSVSDWSGFLCVWLSSLMLGSLLGLMCLKGSRNVFIACCSIVGSVIAMVSLDNLFTVLQHGKSLGLASGLQRSLSPHIGPHTVCQEWDLPGYMLFASAWIFSVLGFVVQVKVTARKGQRHMTKNEVRRFLDEEEIVDDDIRCLRRIDPVTGEMVTVGDGAYSDDDEVSLDDDSTFIENARQRLEFRKAAPVVLQVLAAAGLTDMSSYEPKQAKIRPTNTSFTSRVSSDDLVPLDSNTADDKKPPGRSRRRKLSVPPPKQDLSFPIGSSVLVRYDDEDGGESQQYPATIIGYDAESSYTVKYETNEISYGVTEEYLQLAQ